MLFDLRKFLYGGVSPTVRNFTADLSDRDFFGAKVPMPVEVRFTAQRQEEAVELHLEAVVSISGECARCLDPVSQQYKIDSQWVVRERDFDDEDFELPMDGNGVLDVDAWLNQEVSLEIPPVLLCNPDCLGLCPVCGKKRQDCTCQSSSEPAAPVDERLSILSSLLN